MYLGKNLKLCYDIFSVKGKALLARKTPLFSANCQRDFVFGGLERKETMRITDVWGEFLKYKIVEDEIADETVVKYNDCLQQFIKREGDLEIEKIKLDHFLDLKLKLKLENLSNARAASIIFCMRSLIRYCREKKHLKTLDPSSIKPPKRTKREITYLTNEEIEKFLKAIDLNDIHGLRFRTLCETLLDTGARISEIIQLDRDSIIKGETISYAEIIGKGNKPRKIYFSERGLYWIERYLKARNDDHPAIFVTHCHPKRIKRDTMWRDFQKYTAKSGIKKKITAHIFRHTFGTNLLMNGCGIASIQKLLGHEDINTTIKFYASLDDRTLIKAKQTYLNYDVNRG